MGKEIAENIRLLRVRKRMTQEELAEKCGVSRLTVHNLECGKVKNASTATLLKLAQGLDTTIDQIFLL